MRGWRGESAEAWERKGIGRVLSGKKVGVGPWEGEGTSMWEPRGWGGGKWWEAKLETDAGSRAWKAENTRLTNIHFSLSIIHATAIKCAKLCELFALSLHHELLEPFHLCKIRPITLLIHGRNSRNVSNELMKVTQRNIQGEFNSSEKIFLSLGSYTARLKSVYPLA